MKKLLTVFATIFITANMFAQAPQQTKHQIGENFGGGIVFYVFKPGDVYYVEGELHGLIAATNDMYKARWDDAFHACANYRGGYFSDWYLPSYYELSILYQQKSWFGNFKNDFYWTSSESDNGNPWCWNFNGGGLSNNNNRLVSLNVRPVRSF
jgi:hypothetical protein